MANRTQLILLAALVLQPIAAQAGPVPLFPNPDLLLDQADEAYQSYFSSNDWKLKSIDLAGEQRTVRYQSSTLISLPALERTGIYSWAVRYRLKDRYRTVGTPIYVCRTAAVLLKQRIVDMNWQWSKTVKVELTVDRSDDPCGAKEEPAGTWSPMPERVGKILQ